MWGEKQLGMSKGWCRCKQWAGWVREGGLKAQSLASVTWDGRILYENKRRDSQVAVKSKKGVIYTMTYKRVAMLTLRSSKIRQTRCDCNRSLYASISYNMLQWFSKQISSIDVLWSASTCSILWRWISDWEAWSFTSLFVDVDAPPPIPCSPPQSLHCKRVDNFPRIVCGHTNVPFFRFVGVTFPCCWSIVFMSFVPHLLHPLMQYPETMCAAIIHPLSHIQVCLSLRSH